MDSGGVIERVERITATRADEHADRAGLENAVRDVTALRGWLSAAEADVTRRLADLVSFPEATLADLSRGSTGSASRTIERSRTLGIAPELADALDDGRVTASHVDAVTRAAAEFDIAERQELIERCDRLADVAAVASVDKWSKRVRLEAKKLRRDDGLDRLERQRRATTLTTWVDDEGMWNLRGRFDPVTGVRVASRLDIAIETLFAEQTPDTCPTDPIAKQAHLRALTLARLIEGSGATTKPGRAEFVVVIDTSHDVCNHAAPRDHGQAHGWDVTWPIPVEIPAMVLLEMMDAPSATTHPVIVHNGVVLHAPGELNLGRSTRLANRAQRRALRGIYRTCAIPGCTVSYDRCKLHHVTWWRHGGRTDLDNLLPVCSKHHSKIHHDGWLISLGPNRALDITLPDGTAMATGPPGRRAV